MDEKDYINKLYNCIKNKEYIHQDTIDIIESRFPDNILLHYYLGYYYKQQNSTYEAIEKFKLCIDNLPLFTPPYFELANYIKSPLKLYELFKGVYFKDTYNINSENRAINLDENIRICSFVGNKLKEIYEWIYCIEMYKEMFCYIKDLPYTEITYDYIITWKNINQQLGDMYMKLDPNKAIFYYHQGITKKNYNISVSNLKSEDKLKVIHNIDKNLIISYLISVNHTSADKVELICIDNFFRSIVYKGIKPEKKRIGYICAQNSPFINPLLCDYGNYEIFCYNLSPYNKNVNKIKNWYDIHDLKNFYIFDLIRNEHKINILVDTVVIDKINILEVISQSPAPVIINYSPNSSRLSNYTHFITDKTTDPCLNEKLYTEKVLYMPNLSFCWKPLKEIEIKYEQSNKIRIGIFSNVDKHTPELREIWKSLDATNKYNFYVLKTENAKIMTHLFKNFMNVTFVDHTDFNNIDILLDTFPYSDINNTCNGLYMGLPCYTIKNEKNKHVSNTSGGILFHINEVEYLSKNLKEYKKNIETFKLLPQIDEQKKRIKIRTKFLVLTDPELFIKEMFETI